LGLGNTSTTWPRCATARDLLCSNEVLASSQARPSSCGVRIQSYLPRIWCLLAREGQVRRVLRCPPAHDKWSPTDADLEEQLSGVLSRGRAAGIRSDLASPTSSGSTGTPMSSGARWCLVPAQSPVPSDRAVELVSSPIEFGAKNRDITQYDLVIAQA
jgi:hypothetical protein